MSLRAWRTRVGDLHGVVALLSLSLLSLTPCLGQAQERPFPYELTSRDLWIGGSELGVSALGLYLLEQGDPITMEEIAALDRSSVNSFDQTATYNWSPDWGTTSDWTKNTLVAAAVLSTTAPLILDRDRSGSLVLGAMALEVYFTVLGVTSVTKALAGRTRPYAYNTALSVEERYAIAGPDDSSVFRSFVSGHSAVSFAFATFLSMTYADLYGPSTASKLVWASSLSLASLTAFARVQAGMHFPTDVITGAAVGAAAGYLIPSLHRVGADHGVSLSAGPSGFQISLATEW
jgi:membrane-associated phospholipid phosphatase